MSNVISWFEIPANDFNRACSFYSELLDGTVQQIDNEGGVQMGFLPGHSQGGVGGAVVKGDGYEPTNSGAVVYLNGGDDLDIPLARVEKAGGKVLFPKTAIGENGFIAQFIDTEGNRVALHSIA